MNLAEKKALKTKYLLSGLAPNMRYSHLARFCIREATRNLPPNSGKPMIEDKATKYVVEILSLFPNKKLLGYIAHTDAPAVHDTFNEIFSVMRKNNCFPRKLALKKIRKSTKRIMRVLVPETK